MELAWIKMFYSFIQTEAIYPRVKVVWRASRGKYGEVGVKVGVVTVWSMVVLATPTFTPVLFTPGFIQE